MSEEEDRAQMEKYGITAEPKMVYSFQAHKYQYLKDAVKYAELTLKTGTVEPHS